MDSNEDKIKEAEKITVTENGVEELTDDEANESTGGAAVIYSEVHGTTTKINMSFIMKGDNVYNGYCTHCQAGETGSNTITISRKPSTFKGRAEAMIYSRTGKSGQKYATCYLIDFK